LEVILDRSSVVSDFASAEEDEQAVFVRAISLVGFGGRESGEILIVSNKSRWGRGFCDVLGDEFLQKTIKTGRRGWKL
jgi:hypothetical protein